jgi:hypothetical protein
MHNFEKIILKAWEDTEFRKLLTEHPEQALNLYDIKVPKGKKIIVHHDTNKEIHICIPKKPSELSENSLKKINAGLSNGAKIAIGIGTGLATLAAAVYAKNSFFGEEIVDITQADWDAAARGFIS